MLPLSFSGRDGPCFLRALHTARLSQAATASAVLRTMRMGRPLVIGDGPGGVGDAHHCVHYDRGNPRKRLRSRTRTSSRLRAPSRAVSGASDGVIHSTVHGRDGLPEIQPEMPTVLESGTSPAVPVSCLHEGDCAPLRCNYAPYLLTLTLHFSTVVFQCFVWCCDIACLHGRDYAPLRCDYAPYLPVTPYRIQVFSQISV